SSTLSHTDSSVTPNSGYLLESRVRARYIETGGSKFDALLWLFRETSTALRLLDQSGCK
ncbi:hypothetical protein HHI36_019148, partial [Cryptolaemus montrouzieri]